MTTTKPAEKTATSAKVAAAFGDAGESVRQVSTALTASGRAYVEGIVALGRAFGGFGRETATEVGRHVKATVNARNLREVAELQAAWAQNRVETATAQTKEFVDLARDRSEEVIAPLASLLRRDRAA